ncbi:MAG: hypothetical protein RMM28_07270, partial [Thermoleophilia bacterium]|nr:hypothetical protein [Gaiellaceae bacterium]MDW8338919.1 hypothetical protein [Thermoleophilia bacterium]
MPSRGPTCSDCSTKASSGSALDSRESILESRDAALKACELISLGEEADLAHIGFVDTASAEVEPGAARERKRVQGVTKSRIDRI